MQLEGEPISHAVEGGPDAASFDDHDGRADHVGGAFFTSWASGPITSHNAIAAKLNERNVRTARGGKWTHVKVGTVLRPFEQSEARAVV